MTESSLNSGVEGNGSDAGVASQGENSKKKKSLSMHDDVPVWCDCCSCEAEPYWIELMEKPESD